MTGYLKRIRRKTSDQYQQAFISECQLYLWQPKHHCSLMTEILVPYVLQLLQKSNLCDRDEARTMQDPVSPKSADLQGWLCWGQLPRGGDSPGESPDIDSPIGSHWSITNRFFMISCWVLLICRRLTVTWCWLCLEGLMVWIFPEWVYFLPTLLCCQRANDKPWNFENTGKLGAVRVTKP